MRGLEWNRQFALEQVGNDEEILKELLGLLLQAAITDLDKIKKGFLGREAEAVEAAAHSIKGAAASLGVERLRQVAHGVEKAGRDGDLELAETYLEELEFLVGQLDNLH